MSLPHPREREPDWPNIKKARLLSEEAGRSIRSLCKEFNVTQYQMRFWLGVERCEEIKRRNRYKTETQMDNFFRALYKGIPITKAAKKIGIPYSTACTWKKKRYPKWIREKELRIPQKERYY